MRPVLTPSRTLNVDDDMFFLFPVNVQPEYRRSHVALCHHALIGSTTAIAEPKPKLYIHVLALQMLGPYS